MTEREQKILAAAEAYRAACHATPALWAQVLAAYPRSPSRADATTAWNAHQRVVIRLHRELIELAADGVSEIGARR